MYTKPLLSMAFAVLTLTWTAPASAQDANSAKAFVESVYRLYDKGGKGVDPTGPKATQFFHSSLIALIRADQKAAGPDNVPVLDGDPICSCQERDGIFDLKIDIQSQASERAEAAVSFALFDSKRRTRRDLRVLKITLAREHGGWRVYDIVDTTDPKAPFALRAELKKDIATFAQDSKPKPAQ